MNLLDDTTGDGRFGEAGGSDVLWIDGDSSTNASITIDSLGSLVASDLGVDTLDVSDQANAQSAISDIDTALDSVNTTRANMGATVNRLDHAINNLLVSGTNQQAAESIIRDVDFALETTQFTRNQILAQSGTAMLAQANQMPQNVLQLLG